MIHIGLSSYSLFMALHSGRLDIFGAIRFAAENGAENIEIVPGGPLTVNEENADAIREAVRSAGMTVSSYSIAADFLKPSADERRAEKDRVKREVEIAARLGTTRMRHDCGGRTGDANTQENFEADFPVIADSCGEIADWAERFGIVTSVENHGFYMQGSERLRRLVVAVGRANFRTTLDVGNFLCFDEDPFSAVMNNLPYASMIHFKDFHIRGRNMPPPQPDKGYIRTLHGRFIRGAVTGDGDIDLDGIARLIRQSGYDGCLSVEFEGWGDCLEASARALRNVRNIFDRI